VCLGAVIVIFVTLSFACTFIQFYDKWRNVAVQAQLKSHIHDPNSPELVHFLFTPLSLITEAARDPKLATDLPSNVIAPLLTSSAVALLRNCLTSKEMEFWMNLGDAWTTSRFVFLLMWMASLGGLRILIPYFLFFLFQVTGHEILINIYRI